MPVPNRKELAQRRARLITPGRAIPDEVFAFGRSPECQRDAGDSTTQVSVADRHGNVVSMTQTIGNSFGGGVATPGLGFPYNNLLQNFNFDKPHCPGFFLPRNAVVTDMAPTILVRNGVVVAALGAPGSNRIPPLIANVVTNLVDSRMSLREALVAPRTLYAGRQDPKTMVEIRDPITAADADEIQAMGFDNMERLAYPPTTRRVVVFGGINAIAFDSQDQSWVGVGDAHRWGFALGPQAPEECD
jgi:gamma-glutamyltranspeptidase/glutathione hydrolase